ncbi:MAG: hypothetical protein M3Y49_18045 [Actinomycetota bacterium]|nr:hypothetical protein [Actinomycetota bacterium]
MDRATTRPLPAAVRAAITANRQTDPYGAAAATSMDLAFNRNALSAPRKAIGPATSNTAPLLNTPSPTLANIREKTNTTTDTPASTISSAAHRSPETVLFICRDLKIARTETTLPWSKPFN